MAVTRISGSSGIRARVALVSGRARPFSRRAWLGAMAAGFGSAACSSVKRGGSSNGPKAGAGPAETPKSGGTVNYFLPGNAATLDPQKVTGHQTMTPVGAVMSRLFRTTLGATTEVSLNHLIENDLALSAESPDGLTWTIKLRPDARFHNVPPVNGHAVEAEDVRATFARALDPATNNPSAGQLGVVDVSQIQMPAKDTLVFKLRYAYGPFPALLAAPLFVWVFPREVLNGGYDPAKQIIGSGPFLFDSYTPDVAFVLKRNPDWYEKGRPYVDGVRIAIIPETAQQVAQFSSGHLDILDALTQAADFQTAKKSLPQAATFTSPPTSTGTYYFQLGDPASPFRDIRLRRALSMEIDRPTLAKVLYDDQSEFTFYVPPTFGSWALHVEQLDASTAQFYKQDVPQAKKLFEAAGGPALRFVLAYLANFGASADDSRITQATVNMLQQLSPQITVGSEDYLNDFVKGGKGSRYGNYPWNRVIEGKVAPSIANVDGFLFGYYDSASTSNEGRVKDSQLDGMISKARAMLNESGQRQAYLDVQKYIASQMYSLSGMPQGNSYKVVAPRVRNFTVPIDIGTEGIALAHLWLAA